VTGKQTNRQRATDSPARSTLNDTRFPKLFPPPTALRSGTRAGMALNRVERTCWLALPVHGCLQVAWCVVHTLCGKRLCEPGRWKSAESGTRPLCPPASTLLSIQLHLRFFARSLSALSYPGGRVFSICFLASILVLLLQILAYPYYLRCVRDGKTVVKGKR
jgi:hypothetical protein